MISIEYLSEKQEVDLGIACDDVPRADHVSAAQRFCIADSNFCTLDVIALGKAFKAAFFGIYRV